MTATSSAPASKAAAAKVPAASAGSGSLAGKAGSKAMANKGVVTSVAGGVKSVKNGGSIRDAGGGVVKAVAWKAGPQYGLAAEGAEKIGKASERTRLGRVGNNLLAPNPDAYRNYKAKRDARKASSASSGGSSTADQDVLGKNGKRAAVAGAVVAAPGVAFAAYLAAVLAYLKSLFFTLMAAAMNFVQAAIAFVITHAPPQLLSLGLGAMKLGQGLMAVGKGALNAASFITGGAVKGAALASTTATAVAGTVTSATALGTSGLLLTGMLAGGGSAIFDGSLDAGGNPCTVGGSSSAVTASTTEISADTEKNARIVFSVLSEMGMPEENIAGILGNWSQESGIDATSVEGIFSEPFSIGPQKKKAQEGNFTHIAGQEHGGIGLGQWSNARTPMLLEFAEKNDADWYSIDTQLAFMASGDNPSDVAVFKDMIENSQGSPENAAKHFHDKWERSADNSQMMAERQADAKMWMGKMSGWEVDSGAASQAKDLLDGMVSLGTSTVSTINAGCEEGGGAAGVGSLKDGGMKTPEDAEAITDLYNKEGHQHLMSKFHGGGPGQCNGSYLENCTSFSWYFITKYTTYDRGYAPGNGVDLAGSVGAKIGKETTATPKAYSVFSNGVGSSAGHTGVVLGVEGDKILIGEASYCQFSGRVRWVEASEWKAQNWEFLDMSDQLRKGSGLDDKGDDEDPEKASGSLQAAA
ncbi:phage tail tip lysozyme [Kocuria palustris]|uniref:phage tail tip lysozyme n=1 Tax=Kocuria palustris TaxID=71999 RepID=UPI0012E736F5|nr:phage tail tip lysozyme [Kocuria palustris]